MQNLISSSISKAINKCSDTKNQIHSENLLSLYEASLLDPLESAINMSNKLSLENFNTFTNIFLSTNELKRDIFNLNNPFFDLAKQPRDDLSIISRYYNDRSFMIDAYIQNITDSLTKHYKSSAKICSAAIEVSISDIFDNIYANLFKDIEILSWPMNKFVLQIRMAAEVAKIQMEKNFKSVMTLLVSTSETSANLNMVINKDLVHYLQKQDLAIKSFITNSTPYKKSSIFTLFSLTPQKCSNSYGVTAVFVNNLRADLDDFIEDQKTKIALILKKNTLGADKLVEIFTMENNSKDMSEENLMFVKT